MAENRNLRIWTVFFSITIAAIAVFILSAGAGAEYNGIIGWLGIAVLAWCAITLKRITNTYMSLIFMFEVSFYTLTLGQSFLYAFGIPINTTLDLYVMDSAYDVNVAYLYTILCFLALHYGMLSCQSHPRIRIILGSRPKRSKEKVDYTGTMKSLGWILFPVTFISYAFQWYQLFGSYLASGYAAAFSDTSGATSWNKIFDMVGDYFPYILFLLLAAYRNNRQVRFIIMMMICGIAVLNFAVGNRSEPICYIMAVLWFARRYANTKLQKQRAGILMVSAAVLIVLIIPVIGETRNSGELNLATIIRSFTGEGSFFATIRDTLLSMGWSAFPTVKTMQLIPSQIGYHYGESYFFAALSVIPNVIGGTHISVAYAGLPLWLQNTLQMSYGPGYSMPAEAYYNFGWLGILAMPFIGKIISWILDERNKTESALRLFVMMASFSLLFSIPRREMLTAIRNTTYYVGLICLAIWLLQHWQRAGGKTIDKEK